MSVFVDKVLKAVGDFEMIDGKKTVVVALSGGADSVSLLRVMCGLRGQLGTEVRACHLNHGLRGAESDEDEKFCGELCGKYYVPITIKRLNVKEFQQKHESVEETARRLRYGFFDECLESTGRDSVIASAHTANDNAETVLLNLTRGTGLKGLCGIPPVRDRIIRPLIYCTRADVEEYLAELGQDYVTDKTNFSAEYSRNKIRINVMPQLMSINPSLVEGITRMTANLRSDSDYLERLSDKALLEARREKGYDAAALYALPCPIRSRAVKKILRNGGIEPSALRINTAVSLLCKRSARFNPCKNKFFTIRKGICFTEKIEQKYHNICK